MQALQDMPSGYDKAKTDAVIAAINTGRLDVSAFSPEAIRKAVGRRAYNKITYLFRGDNEVDYHGILRWAAGEADITSRRIKEYSTFRLSLSIAKDIWNITKAESDVVSDFIMTVH